MAQYSIFNNKTVSIPDEAIARYERAVQPFNAHVAEYLAVTSDCEPEDPASVLEAGILTGINEEIQVYGDRHNIVRMAKDAGLFDA